MPGRDRRKSSSGVPTQVRFKGNAASDRARAERFIARVFRAAYGAELVHFMPQLMTLRDDEGRLQAALGLRYPDGQPLFLESYLDDLIEHRLGAITGQPVGRERLVEVGNFAVASTGGGRWLITALTAHLYGMGCEWAVFTCGPVLRNAFRRLGIDLVDIAAADPAVLDDVERARWGSYYQQQPRVMAANVAASQAALAGLLQREQAMNQLWQGALAAGRMAA